MLSKLDLFLEMIQKDDLSSTVFEELLTKNFLYRKEIVTKIINLTLENLKTQKWNKYFSYLIICAKLYYLDDQESFQNFIRQSEDKKVDVLVEFLKNILWFNFEEFIPEIQKMPIDKKLLLVKTLSNDNDFNGSKKSLLIDSLIKLILENKENNRYYPCLLILHYMNKNQQLFFTFLKKYQINLADFLKDILWHFYPDVFLVKQQGKISFFKDYNQPFKNIDTIIKYLDFVLAFFNDAILMDAIAKILKEEVLRNDKFRDPQNTYNRRDENYALKLANFTNLLVSKMPSLNLKVFQNIADTLQEDFLNALLYCQPLGNLLSSLPYRIAYQNKFACANNYNDRVFNNKILLPYIINDFLDNFGLIKYFCSEPAVKWPFLKQKFYEALKTNYIHQGDDRALRVYYNFLTTNISPFDVKDLDLEYLKSEEEIVKKLDKKPKYNNFWLL